MAAAAKEVLLRPAEFTIEKPPTLGKVWVAQERLWIQRTLLEVVAEVNKKAQAKDWDSAIIKEIVSLEVGNPVAQDQRLARQGRSAHRGRGRPVPGPEGRRGRRGLRRRCGRRRRRHEHEHGGRRRRRRRHEDEGARWAA